MSQYRESEGIISDIANQLIDMLTSIKLYALFFGIPFTISLALCSFYTVKSGSAGALSTFGKYNEEAILPGLHFKAPFIQTVDIVDTKMQAANYLGGKDLPDKKGVINKPMINVLDTKNLNIGVELTVMYTPKSNSVPKILSKYGKNYFDKLINPTIRDVVRDVIGKYQAEKIAQERAAIAKEIKYILTKKFENTEFILNEVSLRDIKLPKMVRKKIEEVQMAKQEEQRLEMIEKQAQKEQRIKTTQANTLKIEITTRAQAEAQKAKIQADAKAYTLKKEAEAKAKANEMIARSITNELIKYKSIERWNGDYPKFLMEGKTNSSIIQLPKMD